MTMNVRIDAIMVRIRIATMWVQATDMSTTDMSSRATKNCNAERDVQRRINVGRNRFLVK